MNDMIELYVKVRVPVAALTERNPDCVYSWDKSKPDGWAIAKAEKAAIEADERNVQDFIDLAHAWNRQVSEKYKNGDYGDTRAEIKMNTSAAPTYVWDDVLTTLERAFPYLHREVVSEGADAIVECLGYSKDDMDRLAPREDAATGPDATLLNAVRKLVTYAPHYSKQFAEAVMAGDPHSYEDLDDCLFFLNDIDAWSAKRDGKPYEEDYKTKSGTKRKRRIIKEKRCPFFSEAVLYAIIGKEDARTLLSYIRSAAKKAGLDPREI